MNDEERLEAELGRMRPAAMDAALMERMMEVTQERWTLGDRLLAAWMGLGSVAACAIVSVVVWQMMLAARMPAASPQEVAAQQKLAAEVERLVASR